MTNNELFDTLLSWRLRIADGKSVFLVLQTSTLREIADTRPMQQSELAKIKGMGKVKMEAYADELLSIVRRASGYDGKEESTTVEMDIHAVKDPNIGFDGKPIFSTWVPDIKSAKDLLILREKRKTDKELHPSFHIGAYKARFDDPIRYEEKLKKALTFIDACLDTHDVEGKPITPFAQAHGLRAIGVELPEHLSCFEYLPVTHPEIPSFWADAENYTHLWQQKRRVFDTE
jgi:hypothetical protein